MITVGDPFPDYDMNACVSTDPGNEFAALDHTAHEGRWRVIFFWPMDFTSVCPTEVAEFGRLIDEFTARQTQVLGISTDSEYVHLAWRQHHPLLHDIPFPMLADTKRDLTLACGVMDGDGVALRATFVVDPDNVVQFAMVTGGSIGRNVHEVLRVLDAIQTGQDTPCGWNPGDATL